MLGMYAEYPGGEGGCACSVGWKDVGVVTETSGHERMGCGGQSVWRVKDEDGASWTRRARWEARWVEGVGVWWRRLPGRRVGRREDQWRED